MVFDRYLMKNLLIALSFTALSLACIIMLTQSLRFLELIISSGASSYSFFLLTFLAMPRFFEVILPIALMISTVFVYNRMSADSEISVMRATGFSPVDLSRPALSIAIVATSIVFLITAWIAPVCLSKMQTMRLTIKAQYSNFLLKEGVFNAVGKELTVYIDERTKEGELRGLLIHDSRETLKVPVTILAKKGIIVSEMDKEQVLVFDGSRQEYDEKTGTLTRLDFERYSLDLPESDPIRIRWKEPDEMTLMELLNPPRTIRDDPKKNHEYRVEANRRVVSPFLTITFTAISLCCLLLGGLNRRGLALRMTLAAGSVITLQGLYLIAYNLAKEGWGGLILMYILTFVPLVIAIYLLSAASEKFCLEVKRKLAKVF